MNKPEIPDVAMSFSKPNVNAYVDGNVQRTENIKLNASSQQKITMDLPKGVKLHNVSTGNVSATEMCIRDRCQGADSNCISLYL